MPNFVCNHAPNGWLENINVDDNDKNATYKILSPDAYAKVWKQIDKNIISKLHLKKNVLWFRSRIDMLSFYNIMKDKIIGYKFGEIKPKEEKDKEVIKIVEMYEIDIQKDIINSMKTMEFDKY